MSKTEILAWAVGSAAVATVKLFNHVMPRDGERSAESFWRPILDIAIWPMYLGVLVFLGVVFLWHYATDPGFRRRGVRPPS